MDVSRRREDLVRRLRRRSNATADELARELGVAVCDWAEMEQGFAKDAPPPVQGFGVP
jgi:hypothetical protein